MTPITCWFCSEPFHFLGLVQARYEWAHPKNTAGTQQCFIEGHVIRFDTEFLPRFFSDGKPDSHFFWSYYSPSRPQEILHLIRASALPVLFKSAWNKNVTDLKLRQYSIPSWAVSEEIFGIVPPDELPITSKELANDARWGLITRIANLNSAPIWVADSTILEPVNEYEVVVETGYGVHPSLRTEYGKKEIVFPYLPVTEVKLN